MHAAAVGDEHGVRKGIYHRRPGLDEYYFKGEGDVNLGRRGWRSGRRRGSLGEGGEKGMGCITFIMSDSERRRSRYIPRRGRNIDGANTHTTHTHTPRTWVYSLR